MARRCSLLLLHLGLAHAREDGRLLNISNGVIIGGIGGVGGEPSCRRTLNPDCSALPRQLVRAVDYALDPTGEHLYVATLGTDHIGSCNGAECRGVAIHDNSSRLVYYNLRSGAEPVTLSYCGPWLQVEYDTKNKQVVALRHTRTPDGGQSTYTAEIVAFPAGSGAANDAGATSCMLYPGINVNMTCACAKGLDPEGLNGRVIGRKGLKRDGILPAATLTLLGDEALVGDQNQYCVIAFPLDGSAGATTKGKPVAGTCGKTCGSQGCASIGSPAVPAGRLLGDGSRGNALTYGLGTTPDGRLLLHDMNTETIDYGKAPKAETQFITVPVDPGPSSVYFIPTFQPGSGDLLVLETFSESGYLLSQTDKGGYGNGKKLLKKEDLTGWYFQPGPGVVKPFAVQGVPAQWTFSADGRKLLVLMSYSLDSGSEYFDHAFVQFDVA